MAGPKKVLGRGLSALIPRAPVEEVSLRSPDVGGDTGGTGIIARIDLDRIRPNPFQPRSDFDPDSLEELSRSLLEKGVIQPVTVRRFAGEYQLVSGERRLRAAQNAGISKIPAYIIEVKTDEELLELALIENIQREELNPIEIAHAYERLIAECHLTQEEVAQRVGKERSTVTNYVRLLKLPNKIKDGLRKGLITMGHARPIINLPTEKAQLKLYEKIVKSGYSVRKVESVTRSGRKPARTTSAGRETDSSSVHSVEEQLRRALGTKVTVRSKSGGRGEIIVEFYSLDDLDRILDIVSGR
ncbi:MAG: ParB/RepB/Spo0J family partition protein [Ignavibacteria bacterium]|nr:ParB/RepB/Spo0J family partition protein [Ignavibacteria bacterium]